MREIAGGDVPNDAAVAAHDGLGGRTRWVCC